MYSSYNDKIYLRVANLKKILYIKCCWRALIIAERKNGACATMSAVEYRKAILHAVFAIEFIDLNS